MKRIMLLVAVVAAFSAIAVPQASAFEIAGVHIDIEVNGETGAACGIVGDRLTNSSYTAVLTATGAESTVLANGTIIGTATGSGNPVTICTPGGRVPPLYRTVEYTLEWTSILGTTGSLTKTCVWIGFLSGCTVS